MARRGYSQSLLAVPRDPKPHSSREVCHSSAKRHSCFVACFIQRLFSWAFANCLLRARSVPIAPIGAAGEQKGRFEPTREKRRCLLA